ncbi:matrixin family metalloprotease [Candidatus Falkowbacteria bacterium]|nr:matrixin family metalloprotease [Candidatus Falkowbacteria bacterium]
MIKKILSLCLISALLAVAIPALAKSIRVPATVKPSGRTVIIPQNAIQVAPHVFSLGTSVDPQTGKLVEGYAVFKYKDAPGKPGTSCGNGVCEPGENANKCPSDCGGGEDPVPDDSTCYGYLAKGAKWKTTEDYLVNATNTSGLDENLIRGNVALDISKWEDASDGAIDGILGYNILGNEVEGEVDGADTIRPDGKNELYFGEITNSNAIAVTIIWGIFNGRPTDRELVEWDQVYDEVDYDWSLSGEAGKMDFESIATHELGHSTGLADLYTSDCSEQTMYGYADYGETKKQTLEAGDITGIDELY